MNSSLVEYTCYSPNHSGQRNHAIDTITPHYMGGNCTIETCGEIFSSSLRMASSNYGIGSDGRIGMYVEEDHRAWTSGDSRNDNRAITIECANLGDGSLTQACWDSLVKLCVDICQRYGYSGVWYLGEVDYDACLDGFMLLTMHKWFQDTDCPGPWLSHQFQRLQTEVNLVMESGVTPSVKPKNNTNGGKLDVDGWAGYNTILDLQNALNTPEDGVLSGQWLGNQPYIWAIKSVEWGGQGSMCVEALQRLVDAQPDGLWGAETSWKVQDYLLKRGYDVGASGCDSRFGNASVRGLQRCLNDGNLL